MFVFYSVVFSLMVSFFLFIFFFFMFSFLLYLVYTGEAYLVDWEILSLLGVSISFSLVFDWISVSFSFVVGVISFSVIWFSYYYMFGDQYVYRFTWLVVLFVMSMVFLIFIPNLISLLIGWDGLGLISFCLVVYYQNFKSLVSGVITVLMNRVGDVMILLSSGWLFSFGSWGVYFLEDFHFLVIVSFCLVVAGMTKSAQFPFCSWLPAAMAAPTPVSALVHSSTLVTAGVYLIIRFWGFISLSEGVVFFLQVISLLTMFLSGFSAMFESDLKKIIALSTLSQLSVMMFSISFGYVFVGLFHLYTHALFKALLFLCAGCLIHMFFHVQDLRNLGSCWSLSPCVMVFFNISNLALCGFPFFGGFYSKDVVLEGYIFSGFNFFFFFFLFLSTALTVGYSVRLVLFSFLGVNKMVSYLSKSEEELNFLFPMVFLGSGALFGGYFFFSLIFEGKCFFFFPSVLDKFFILLVLCFGMIVGSLSFLFSLFRGFGNFSAKILSFFGGSMWFLQYLSSQGILSYPFFVSVYSLYSVDRGYLEYLGGQGVINIFSRASVSLNLFSGKSVLFSVIFVFFFFVYFFYYLVV